MSDTIPIIKTTIEGMRYSMAQAMTEHFAEMDETFQKVLEEVLTEKNIEDEIRQAAREVYPQQVKRVISQIIHEALFSEHTMNALEQVVKRDLQNKIYEIWGMDSPGKLGREPSQ